MVDTDATDQAAASGENDQVRTVQVVADSDGLVTMALSCTLGANLRVTATSSTNLNRFESKKWAALPIGLHL